MIKLPPKQIFPSGLTVCYFEHKGQVCLWKQEEGKEKEYTKWDSSKGWQTEKDFYQYF